MPRPRPGRQPRNFGTTVPKSPHDPLGTVPASPVDQDLAARLKRILGSSLDEIEPTLDTLADWSLIITKATHSSFEHRLLLGIGFNAMKPSYGGITEQQEAIAEAVGRTSRWVRETVQVATAVQLAFDQGYTLPLEIRDLPWRKVPGAVENIRQDRAFDFQPEKEKVEPTPDELAQAVSKAVKSLTKALEAIQSPTQRQSLATDAIEALQPYTEADVAPEPEPAVGEGFTSSRSGEAPQPPAPESEPEPRDPSHPRRPGRNRPGRGPRRRR
jgi:hypothetical protein